MDGEATPATPLETETRAREVRYSLRETRIDPARKLVRGEVYVPFDPNVDTDYPLDTVNDLVDTWGTFIRPPTLERLAHDYLQFYRNVDRMHDRQTRAGDPVESYISDGREGYVKGAWIMAVRVADHVWPQVANKDLTGFSIDVLSRRKPTMVRVKGSGETMDLSGVSAYPYMPKRATVRGSAMLRLDELHDMQPNFVSIVDRAANRRMFEQRGRMPSVDLDAYDREVTIVRCDLQPDGTVKCGCQANPANEVQPRTPDAPSFAEMRMPESTKSAITEILDNTPGLVRIGVATRRDGSIKSVEFARASEEEAKTVTSAPVETPTTPPPAAGEPAQRAAEPESFIRGAVPYASAPEGKAGAWDADAAVKRLRTWAGVDKDDAPASAWSKYAEGFGAVDGDPKNFGSYKLPHHDVEDGHLVLSRPGLMAAGAVMQGARGGVELPESEMTAAKSHLEKHYHDLKMKAPWESESTEERARPPAPLPVDNPKQEAPTGRPLGGIDSTGGTPIARAADPVPTTPADDDEAPVTQGFFRRALEALGFGKKSAETTAPLATDGTPPAEIRAEAVVAPVSPEALAAQAAAATVVASAQPVQRDARVAEKFLLERAMRSMGKDYGYADSSDSTADAPLHFSAEWAHSELCEELDEATDLLDDVLESASANLEQFSTGQAYLDHVHAQLDAYLQAVTKILNEASAGGDAMAALRQSRGTPEKRSRRKFMRALALTSAVIDREQRLGAKYSSETVDKIRSIHEALTHAVGHTGDIMKEIEGRSGIPGAESDPLNQGTRPGAVKPQTPEASVGSAATDGLGPQGTQTPAGEGPKIPTANGGPGAAGMQAAVGTQGQEGPGSAESYGRAVEEAVKRMTDKIHGSLDKLHQRLDALESPAGAPEKRTAPVEPTPPPAPPQDPVLRAIAELGTKIDTSVKQVEERVAAVETRRQPAGGVGGDPLPLKEPIKRGKNNWAEGLISGQLEGAKGKLPRRA